MNAICGDQHLPSFSHKNAGDDGASPSKEISEIGLKKEQRSMLKQVTIEVTDAAGKIEGRWENGTTTVILSPHVPPVTGLWKSARPGDLDSGAGSRGSKPKEDLKRIYD